MIDAAPPDPTHGSARPSSPASGQSIAVPEGVTLIREMTPGELDATERITNLHDDSWALREVITVWRAQSDVERSLRKTYATALLLAMAFEAAFADCMLVLLGAGHLSIPQWVANVFFATVFGQIAAGVLAVTRYLFPPGGSDGLLTELLRLRVSRQQRGKGSRRSRRDER